MTQALILIVLGIGIGYSITLWLQRSSRTSDELAKKEGAEIVMFVNDKGDLVAVDTETGRRLEQFDDSSHELHAAVIRFDELGEPVLYDREKERPIVVHKKPDDKEYRVPIADPESDRYIHASVIYFWRYRGSTSCCTWSGGKHVVRRRP